MTDPAFQSAKSLAGLVRRGRVGCLELLDHFIARVERYDGQLNAVVVRDFERARKRARAMDRKGAKAEGGPLFGVPMTVKESFDIAGLPTTWGDPAFKDTRATRDALAVRRLAAAGAVIFGKTNVPLNLADWQSFNAIYGTTNNPWDTALSPGGSSGGAAAALAAGLTGLEVGSDIGASIRNPAHYCGVFGHKPTWGICPPLGQALGGAVAQSDISVIGPMARSAADLALALDVIAGPEEIEARGLRLALPPPRVKGFAGLRVAIMATDPNLDTDDELAGKLEELGKFLRRQGAKVSTTARPEFDTRAAHRNYVLMLRATTSARQSDAAMETWRRVAARLGPEDNTYLGLMARGNIMSHRDFLRLDEERQVMRRAWGAFFREWDVLLCPAAASAAQPHDHKGERHERLITVNNKRVPTTDQLFWAGISCHFLLPGTVAPLGFTSAGLPLGVQIVGPQYGDRATIHLAHLLERAWQGFVPPPGFA
jgi:amidase